MIVRQNVISVKGQPEYKVTNSLAYRTIVECNVVATLAASVRQRLNDVLWNDVNGVMWVGLCTGTTACDNLQIDNINCVPGQEQFSLTFSLSFARFEHVCVCDKTLQLQTNFLINLKCEVHYW